MNNYKKIVPYILFSFITFHAVNAQVTGTITNTDNATLPGVTVQEKGTTNGVISDFDGNYAIETTTENPMLVFSYLGFKNQNISVNGQTKINVVLETSINEISEVVVLGYGSQIKKEVTSSISTIKSLDDGGNSSLGELLQGKASGIQINTTDASPGSPIRVTVRGTNSITSGTEPLWIVDGFPINSEQEDSILRSTGGDSNVFNPLANINPDDIESVQVLKDAASTSIYGSRGANGVILITTKKGKPGKFKASISLESGISTAVNFKKYVNGSQYLELLDEARTNSGLPVAENIPGFFDFRNPDFAFFNRSYIEEQGINNDWLDRVLKPGSYTKIYTSASGGTKGINYFLSLYNKNTEGIIAGDERKDYSFSTKVNVDFTEKISAGVNVRYAKNDYTLAQKGGGPNNRQAGQNNWGGRAGWLGVNTRSLPVYPETTPTGVPFDPFGGFVPTYALRPENQLNDNKESNADVSASLTYKPTASLSFDVKAGITDRSRSQFLFIGENIRNKSNTDLVGSSRGVQNTTSYFNQTFNAVASYNKKFKSIKFNFILGGESFDRNTKVEFADFEDLTSQQIAIGDAQAATFLRGRYFETSSIFLSGFSRLNTTIKDKYLIGATVRYDGSSVFAPKNRWGAFGAVSAGWIISEESFLSNVDAIKLLKIRASYGSTGNASIPNFKFLNTYNTWPVFGENSNGLIFENIATDNLTWERSFTSDIALDYQLFNNRISGSIGIFQTKTVDMLLDTPIAPSLGAYSQNEGPSALINVGELTNEGFEFEIASTNINIKNFKWKTSFNITAIRNEVGKLADGITNPLQIGYTPPFRNRLQVNSIWAGEKLGRFYVAEYAGLDNEGYQTIYEIDREKFQNSNQTITEKTGRTIRATRANVQNNRIYQNDKTGLPTYFGGITNTFSYKNISLNVVTSFSGGNYIYDQTVAENGSVNTGRNVINEALYGNTFIPGVRENTKYPIQTFNNLDANGDLLSSEHTANLHKGDFIRIQNVRLGYNIPSKHLSKLNLTGVNIYANATNLFLFSEFKEFDPEFVNYGDINAVTSDRNLGQGYINSDPFPKARTISIGTRVSF